MSGNGGMLGNGGMVGKAGDVGSWWVMVGRSILVGTGG